MVQRHWLGPRIHWFLERWNWDKIDGPKICTKDARNIVIHGITKSYRLVLSNSTTQKKVFDHKWTGNKRSHVLTLVAAWHNRMHAVDTTQRDLLLSFRMVDGIASFVHWCTIRQVAHVVREQSTWQGRTSAKKRFEFTNPLVWKEKKLKEKYWAEHRLGYRVGLEPFI